MYLFQTRGSATAETCGLGQLRAYMKNCLWRKCLVKLTLTTCGLIQSSGRQQLIHWWPICSWIVGAKQVLKHPFPTLTWPKHFATKDSELVKMLILSINFHSFFFALYLHFIWSRLWCENGKQWHDLWQLGRLDVKSVSRVDPLSRSTEWGDCVETDIRRW